MIVWRTDGMIPAISNIPTYIYVMCTTDDIWRHITYYYYVLYIECRHIEFRIKIRTRLCMVWRGRRRYCDVRLPDMHLIYVCRRMPKSNGEFKVCAMSKRWGREVLSGDTRFHGSTTRAKASIHLLQFPFRTFFIQNPQNVYKRQICVYKHMEKHISDVLNRGWIYNAMLCAMVYECGITQRKYINI